MRRAGFSLIEALVALAIASLCLLALFGLQQQLARSQVRYEAAQTRAQTRRNILALVRDLNPAAQPAGEVALPEDERLTWTSRPAGPVRRALTVAGAPSPFAVQVFTVEATLTDRKGVPRDTVSVERMGWRKLATAGAGAGLTPSTL